MRRIFMLTSAALPLALAGCGDRAAEANQANEVAANTASANQAAPAENQAVAGAEAEETELRRETVAATFLGWEMGDYLWARFEAPGREPFTAQPEGSPVDLFLDAHRGQPVTVEIVTVRANVPEAGGPMEIARVTSARTAAADAEGWWTGLSEAEQAAAQRRFEEGALSGR